MNSRAKFSVQSVTKTGKTSGSVKLSATYDTELHTEDHAFQTATPFGTIEMGLSGSGTQLDFFEVGKSYYVDFTPID